MHRIIRIALLIFTALMLIGFLFLGVGYRLVTRSLPRASGDAVCPGLKASAEIFRDEFGVPYVIAADEADLMFLQGYITARDRFFQMDFNRHLAAGRLSDMLRTSGLRTDSLMRRANLTFKAAKDFTRLPGPVQNVFRSYSDGINAYLDTYRDKPPLEYTLLDRKPLLWRPEESLALLELHAYQRHAGGLLRVWIEMADLESDSAASENIQKILKEDFLHVPAQAQLSCIVSGGKSASGRPLLAASYNDPAVLPDVWYEIHLFGPDRYAGGLSLPGVPMILCGRNRTAAWAAQVRQNWSAHAETKFTHSLGFVKILHGIMRSGGTAAERKPDPVWRLLAADTLGRVYADDVPAGAAADWIASDGARTASSGDALPPTAWRLRRLAALLNADSAWTSQQMRDVLSDSRSLFAQDVMRRALPAIGREADSGSAAGKFIEKLSGWNGEMRPGSAEALVFHTWIAELVRREDMSPLFDHLHVLSDSLILEAVKRESGRERIRRALADAVELLREKWDGDASLWSWGAARTVTFRHRLKGHPLLGMAMNLGPFHTGGSPMTLCASGHPLSEPRRIVWTESARFIADLGDPHRTFSALASGQSGQPVDTHYRDQIALFLSHDMHPNWMDIDRIRRSGWEHLTLNPGGSHDE